MKYKVWKHNKIIEEKSNKSLLFLYHTRLGRFILKLIYNKKISNIAFLYLNSKLSRPMINKYINKYHIDMSLYKNKEYTSFNDFFKREIKHINKTESAKDFISICDSKVMVYKIEEGLKITVKNSVYSLDELIKDNLNKEYINGLCIIYRLEPKDYHHYIFNDDGKIISHKCIDGKLHTVNPIVYDHYKVFTENKREVSILKTKNFDEIIQIEVGALCVGRIQNKKIKDFKKYNEKGYFEFGGSTIIQLIKKNVIEIDKENKKNSEDEIETQVQIGDIIGKKKK